MNNEHHIELEEKLLTDGHHEEGTDKETLLTEMNKQKIENRKVINKLLFVSVFCCIFMTAEIVGGYISNSLAIMTDAAHLLSDLLGFIISICALLIGQYAPTSHLTYGYHRAEIVGALTSVILIWGLTAWLIYAAIWRLILKVNYNLTLFSYLFFIATC